MNNRLKSLAFKLSLAAMMTAVAVAIAYFLSTTFIIAGIPGLRVSFHGPFLQFVSIAIGPVFGGMAYAIRDLVGFLLRPLPPGFLWQLMVTDFFCGVAIGLLWIVLKRVKINVRVLTVVLGVVFFALFLGLGVINLVLFESGALAGFLDRAFVNAAFVDGATWGLISTGIAGLAAMLLCHVLFHFVYRHAEDREEKLQRAFKLLIAVGAPTMLVTLVNSFILYNVMAADMTQALMFFTITRLIRRVFTIFYDVYILVILITIFEKTLGRVVPELSLAQQKQRRADGDKQGGQNNAPAGDDDYKQHAQTH